MSFFLRLLSIPLNLIKSPAEFVSGFWHDGGRGQFLVMGMPAVIFMALGVTSLALAFVNTDGLDLHYQNLAQRANNQSKKIRQEIHQNERFVGATSTTASSVDSDNTLREDLKRELDKEKIYLEKLIDLDKSNPEHKYKFALLAFQQQDPQKGLSLMQVIGPFKEPGYAKAHLFLAEYFLRQTSGSTAIKQQNLKRAEIQIDNCLIAEDTNLSAKKIKAYIHDQKRQYPQAYEIYKELFEADPIYYQDLLRLAKIQGKDSDRILFLDRASSKFLQLTEKKSDNVAEWVNAWSHYVHCMKLKKEFSRAEIALQSELQNYRDDIGKQVFLKRELSKVYSDRAIGLGRDASLDTKKRQLADLAKSIENHSKNEAALQWLTLLGNNPDIGEEARKIYDPRFDPNPPWVVLSEMGHHALRMKNHEEAIRFFERARKKNPRNEQVLNNLAYAYLVAENRNPEQALLLVDQALTILRNSPNRKQEFVSSFYDTRGLALMQLDRMKEAAAAFEIAFQNRPNSADILRRLIKVYAAIGDERQEEAARRRLGKLEKQEADIEDRE